MDSAFYMPGLFFLKQYYPDISAVYVINHKSQNSILDMSCLFYVRKEGL